MMKKPSRILVGLTLLALLATGALLWPNWHTHSLIERSVMNSISTSPALRHLLADPYVDGFVLIRHLQDKRPLPRSESLTVGDACLAVLNERWELHLDENQPGRGSLPILWDYVSVPVSLPEDHRVRSCCEDAVQKSRFGKPKPFFLGKS